MDGFRNAQQPRLTTVRLERFIKRKLIQPVVLQSFIANQRSIGSFHIILRIGSSPVVFLGKALGLNEKAQCGSNLSLMRASIVRFLTGEPPLRWAFSRCSSSLGRRKPGRRDRIIEIDGRTARDLGIADVQALCTFPAHHSMTVRTSDQRRIDLTIDQTLP